MKTETWTVPPATPESLLYMDACPLAQGFSNILEPGTPLQRRFVKDTLIITTDFKVKVIVGGSNEQNMIVLFIDCFKWSSLYMTCLIIQYRPNVPYFLESCTRSGKNTHRLHRCIRHIVLLLSEIM